MCMLYIYIYIHSGNQTCQLKKKLLSHIFPMFTSNWDVQLPRLMTRGFFQPSKIGGVMIRFATSVLEKMLPAETTNQPSQGRFHDVDLGPVQEVTLVRRACGAC